MKQHVKWLPDFPRGGRILRLGCPVECVQSVSYINIDGKPVVMDPKAYLLHVDRLILAQDVWPRTHEVNSGVWIYYRTIA